MSQTVREIADKLQADGHYYLASGLTKEGIADIKQLAAHVLASTEPLGDERLREIVRVAVEEKAADFQLKEPNRLIQLQDEIADLRAQLQDAQQHQKESDERISNQREEIKRQASELATLHRRIQIYCNWKYESDDKIKSIQQLATPAATPPAQPDSVVKDYLTTQHTDYEGYRCKICNGQAEWSTVEKVWRHVDLGIRSEHTFCEKYGYPISVRKEPLPTHPPAQDKESCHKP